MLFNITVKYDIETSTGLRQTVYGYSSIDGQHLGTLIKFNREEAKETLRKLYPNAKFRDDNQTNNV